MTMQREIPMYDFFTQMYNIKHHNVIFIRTRHHNNTIYLITCKIVSVKFFSV